MLLISILYMFFILLAFVKAALSSNTWLPRRPPPPAEMPGESSVNRNAIMPGRAVSVKAARASFREANDPIFNVGYKKICVCFCVK